MKNLRHTLNLVCSLLVLMVCFHFGNISVHAQTFSFGAVGDYANGSNFQATVAQVKSQNPDFHIAVGDLAYTTAEQSWCNTWKNAGYNNILITSGNHDSGESSSGNINNYVQFCPYTLSSPLTGTYGKQYYFDYPPTNPTARFILISAGLGGSFIGFDTNYAVGSQGYTFVQNAIDDARTQGIKWVIVGTHKNCLSMGTKSCEIGTALMNLLFTKRVDLVLQGHDHNYQRSKQLTCANTNTYTASCVADDGADGVYRKGAGTVTVIQGTGGQGQYTINTSDSEASYFAKWEGSNSNQTFGFNKYTVFPTQLTAQFVRTLGGTFTDSFTITENSGITPSPAPSTPQLPSPTPTRKPNMSPTPSSCPQAPTPRFGEVTSVVNVPHAGTYTVWSRIMASSSTGGNAYWLQVDCGPFLTVGDLIGMPTDSWQWINYQDGSATNIITVNLTAGTHTVTLVGKEQGVKVDKIVLSAQSSCTPIGFGDNCLTTPTTSPDLLKADIDHDGCVGILDFNTWFQAITGNPRSGTSPDINNDGTVDIVDFNWWFRAMVNLPPDKVC